MNILVLGIGQSLRGDDASGLEAVQLWQQTHPWTAARVRVVRSEFPGLGLLELLDGMDAAVIVDAVLSRGPAGTVIRLCTEELACFKSEAGFSHGWGVAETLGLGISIKPGLTNCRITLIGVVGVNFGIGMGLSPAVRAALPKAGQMIEKELVEWLEMGNKKSVEI